MQQQHNDTEQSTAVPLLSLQDLALYAVEWRQNKYTVFEHDRTTVVSLVKLV